MNDGNLFYKSNAPSDPESDGNDNGETENEDNHDYSGAGYTISVHFYLVLCCAQ